MISLDPQQQTARTWFESLRDRICAEFEAIEAEAGSDARFAYTPWDREADGLEAGEGGGGVRGVMTGSVFEKVGVNVSTVGGQFAPDFAASIHGAGEDPSFFRHGNQPRRAYGEPPRPCRPYEHPLPCDDEALVRRRRRFEPADRICRGHRRLSRAPARRVRAFRSRRL